MVRLLSAAFAFVAIASAAYGAGTTYRDPQARFIVTVPDGWAAEVPVDQRVALFIVSPTVNEVRGACVVAVTPMPQTSSMSQAELDQTFAQVFTKEFWLTSLQAAGLKDVELAESGHTTREGRQIHYIVATATLTRDGATLRAKGKQNLHVIPGSLQIISCTAKVENFAQFEADFDGVLESFVPKSGDIIARAPQGTASILTLYANRHFEGPTRVLTSDTPNLPALGWRGVTASFAVGGYGQWEICEGVGYRGACHLVVGSASAQPAQQLLRIGSARRYASARDFRGGISLAGEISGAQLKLSSEYLARRGGR